VASRRNYQFGAIAEALKAKEFEQLFLKMGHPNFIGGKGIGIKLDRQFFFDKTGNWILGKYPDIILLILIYFDGFWCPVGQPEGFGRRMFLL